MANDVSQKKTIGLAIGLLLVMAALIGGDLWTDYRAGTTASHIALESVVLLLAAAGVAILWREFQVARETVAGLRVDVETARREAAQWRDETKATMGELRAAIDRQFERWKLSGAERDVAMCLLRGLCHKEVAGRRKTSERTVREQARTVYQKSGVGGRSELAAFFLADLTKNREG